MGANAQTTVPTFVDGQVLTAAQQNQSARTGVPVFATTVERDAAFGGAGEKTLAEGQLCYLEDTNIVQYYDGAVWATVGPTQSGLVFISGATFTTQATVSMPAGTFTSTYKNYKVMLDITASSASGQILSVRVNSAGSPLTTAIYNGSRITPDVNGNSAVTASNGATSFNANALFNTSAGSLAFEVFQAADAGLLTEFTAQGTGLSPTSHYCATYGGCVITTAAAHDGLTFFVSGTISGQYRVYGYSES